MTPDPASPALPEMPPIADPVVLLGLLRAGDRLAHCLVTGWRLVRADVAATEAAVGVLRRGCLWFAGTNEPYDFQGGCLSPLGDGLPGFGTAQTWMWAEGASHGRH